MSHRKKMCKHCAFRENSPEMQDKERRKELLTKCLSGRFICHETMLQTNEGSKWTGDFDISRRADGSNAEKNSHQLCAGFVKMFGHELGINASDIPAENHAICA